MAGISQRFLMSGPDWQVGGEIATHPQGAAVHREMLVGRGARFYTERGY